MVEEKSQSPGEEPQGEVTDRSSEKGEKSEGRLKTINIVQQNAIIISGRKENERGSGPDGPRSGRWL